MRMEKMINDSWLFSKTCTEAPCALPTGADWEPVTLPHTWNTTDGQMGRPYERGACWYVREIPLLSQPVQKRRTFIEIGAAAMYSQVWFNGQKICEHGSGYSGFRVEITDLLQEGQNILAILCDNTYSDAHYPQMADFIFYGGLYRYVKMICVPESCISLEDHGGSGVYIDSTPVDKNAKVKVRTLISNPADHMTVSVSILDGNNVVAQAWGKAEAETHLTLFIPGVSLWDGPENPNLYRAVISLQYMNEIVDEVTVNFGVRSYHLDPEQGFFLNGRSFPIRGVCRHQDTLFEGNALTPEEAWRDMKLISDMGVNGVRLAHYQQSQDIYDACDAYGLCTWAEIPYFARSWDDSAHELSREELRELIIQNYNHPAIFFWGISNEIYLMGNHSEKLLQCHQELNAIVKELDPERISVLASDYDTKWDDPIHEITDAEGWNHYFGWYRGTFEDLDKWVDEYHAKYPHRMFAISEYGCDAITDYHNEHPQQRDYSEEWQVLLHEHALETFRTRPWIWGTFVWNMFDFGSFFRREGGTKGRNNKGLVSFDRKRRKDSYCVYKAWFSKDPFVHIDGRRYYVRPEETTQIKVHSNASEVSLYINGKLFETMQGEHTFLFKNVPLCEQPTAITARASGCSDTITLRFNHTIPGSFSYNPAKDEKINWKDLDAAVSPDQGKQ